MSNIEIKLQNVSLDIDGKSILNNISFSAKKGEIIGIIGNNGAGKSSLLKIIAGTIKSANGNVEVSSRGSLSFCMEKDCFFSKMTVEENLTFFKRISRIDYYLDISECMKMLDLDKYKDYEFHKLSKGNKKKVNICSSIFKKSDILILDEPMSGLDISSKQKVEDLIMKYANDKIVLISSHNINVIEKLCDKILVISYDFSFFGTISDFKCKYNFSDNVINFEDTLRNCVKGVKHEDYSD